MVIIGGWGPGQPVCAWCARAPDRRRGAPKKTTGNAPLYPGPAAYPLEPRRLAAPFGALQKRGPAIGRRCKHCKERAGLSCQITRPVVSRPALSRAVSTPVPWGGEPWRAWPLARLAAPTHLIWHATSPHAVLAERLPPLLRSFLISDLSRARVTLLRCIPSVAPERSFYE